MRNKSSLIAFAVKSSSTTGTSVHSLSRSLPSSGAKACAVRSRRNTSSARFFAVAISQAEGFWGTPRRRQTSNARQKASCTTSCQREVVNTENARQRGDHAPRLASEEMVTGLHYMLSCWTGRTSTEPPTSRIGQPFEISTACARSLASISV